MKEILKKDFLTCSSNDFGILCILSMNPEDKLLLKWPNYLYSLFPTAKTVSERALLLPSGIGSTQCAVGFSNQNKKDQKVCQFS